MAHSPDGATSRMRVDISTTNLPPDAILGYWASKDTDEVLEAADAYDGFRNSGIVQCRAHTCDLALDVPGEYTSEGMVFPPHVHWTEWLPDGWSPQAKTLNLRP